MLVGGEKVALGLSNTGVENYVDIPLAGDVAGCLVRTDREARPWFSPAGTRRGRILNVIRLKKNPTAAEQDALYNSEINSVIGIAGSGTYLFGDITKEGTATSTLTRINVVRLINYIKKTLGRTAFGVLFEVNDVITRSLFTNAARGFLQQIQDGRGLYGFKIVCDDSNNPGAIIDANQFVADVFIKPTKSINYVKLVITNVNTDAVL
jgi:phage tail sheath protein FI